MPMVLHRRDGDEDRAADHDQHQQADEQMV